VVEELSREGARVEAPAPPEPPRELWFRRRVQPLAALRELWQFRELTLSLAERDLRIRYSQAALGAAWAILTPLLLMLAFALVFTRFTRIDTHGAPYTLFAYLGLLPWTFFASAVANGGTSLTLNVPLLNKLYCPREVFPLAQVLVAAVDAAMATLVLFVLFAITGYAPRAEAFWVPLLLLVLLAFTTGCTIAISVVVVYMRDLRLALPLALQFAIFVTPVAYGADVIAHSTAQLSLYSALNPLVAVIDGLRRTVLWGQAPEGWPLLAGAGTSTLVLVGGYLLFKRLETGIADIA
jgi:ABC-2 type transport system permease protein/lipopolysaccharide transport system permease protein